MASIHTRTNPLDRSSGESSAIPQPRPASRFSQRLAALLAVACMATSLVGCDTVAQQTSDYLNLRNSFMDPSQVGRFDINNPWGRGTVRPVKWPILTQLDVIDQNNDPFAAATDPTAADLVPDKKEFLVNPGDVIHISVFGLQDSNQEFARDLVVSQNGTVTIFSLGNVNVAGLTPTQIQEKIAQATIDNKILPPPGNGNPGPQVAVSILQAQNRIFSVIGTVAHPGTYSIYIPDLRLLTALSQVGDVGVQPGLDYIYIIRTSQEGAGAPGTALPAEAPQNGVNPNPPVAPPTRNPLDALESIEKSAPSTTPSTAPATAPQTAPGAGTGPTMIRPIATAEVVSGSAPAASAPATSPQSDLDAAISGGAVPGAAASTAPTPKPPTTVPAEDLLNQAVGTPTATRPGQYVFVDGKWILLPAGATPPASSATSGAGASPTPSTLLPTPNPTVPGVVATTQPTDVYGATENMTSYRVIRIPLDPLRAGDPRYNIIVRPGDVINVPTVETGEFYMMGHINRPGVYSLTGRKITLMMAVAAAGNLDSLAIPRKCDLIRRIGTNQQAIVQVNLQAVFNGEQPDIFLKPNDVLNVGSDAVAPFLAVVRNAYRLSYGFGFVYDRNFAAPANQQ